MTGSVLKSNVNVLLLLSVEQEPDPEIEVLSLKDICKEKREVWFATTRHLGALAEGAEVSFYADGDSHYRLLARACFLSFVTVEDRKKTDFVKSELYSSGEPQRLRGYARLTDFELLSGEVEFDILKGVLADGEKLGSDMGQLCSEWASSVYYAKIEDGCDISDVERMELYAAKCAELEDKYCKTRRFWARESSRLRETIETLENEIEKRLVEEDEIAEDEFKGTAKKYDRALCEILDKAFPYLNFLGDSVTLVRRDYARYSSLFRVFYDINYNIGQPSMVYGCKTVKGAKGWYEIYAASRKCRVYYRSLRRDGKEIMDVLVSKKKIQDKEIEWLKRQ